MISLSVSEFCTKRWSFFQDVLQTTTRGFDGIGIWRAKAEDEGIHESIELIHEMQLNVSSVSWVGGFTGCDGRSHKDAVADGLEAIHFARHVEAGCVIVHAGGRNNHTDNHARRLVTNALDELVETASHLGIKLALEPMQGFQACKWNFFRQFDEALEIVERYSPADVGIVLDLYHWGHDGELFRKIPKIIDRIALVQVADRQTRGHYFDDENRRIPGFGSLPLVDWLGQLDRHGYSGFCELEIHGYDVASFKYPQILDLSQNVMSNLIARAESMSALEELPTRSIG